VITQDSKKREMVLSILREGDLFGEIALLTGKPRTATVIANMATELLELSRSDYKKLISKHPRIKKVVEALHQARAHKTVEAMIQSYREESK
jgi:CRP-like cAMP-binding protein